MTVWTGQMQTSFSRVKLCTSYIQHHRHETKTMKNKCVRCCAFLHFDWLYLSGQAIMNGTCCIELKYPIYLKHHSLSKLIENAWLNILWYTNQDFYECKCMHNFNYIPVISSRYLEIDDER